MLYKSNNYNKDNSIEIPSNSCYDNLALKSFFKNVLDSLYKPLIHTSSDYTNWIAILDLRTCVSCRKLHGKIYYADELPQKAPPLHERCRCKIVEMMAAFIGTATKEGINGPDVYISKYGRLPGNYITKQQANKLGWINYLGNLGIVAPGKIIGGDVYRNRDGHLPYAPGRIWYEADINYDSGYRNLHRIIYSNDGLIFATYDHYLTFVQIH